MDAIASAPETEAAERRLFRGPADLVLAARVAIWVALSSPLLRLFGIDRALALVHPLRSARLGAAEMRTRGRRIQRYADGFMRKSLFGGTPVCWKRAVAVHRLLPRGDADVRILFGVERGEKGDLMGHAWVELDGVALDGTDPDRYQVTLTHPGQGSSPRAVSARARARR